MKKRTKRFLGTLAIIGVFTIGTVFGSETILKFEGTNTIEEAKTLIQELTQERNAIVDEYNKLDTVATDKINELNTKIEDLNTQISDLTKQINDYENGKTYLELNEQIKNLQNKISSLEDEIKRKDNELSGKDRLLEEKDEKIKYYENIEPTKEIARLNEELNKANSKCEELQNVINGVTRKEFEKSKLMEDN